MKKIIIIVTIVILLLGTFTVCLWAHNNPNIVIGIGKPEGEPTRYIENVMLQYDERFGIPIAQDVQDEINDFATKTLEKHQEILTNNEGPIHIEVDLEFVDGTTIVKYQGTVTDKNGNSVDYNQKIEFPYTLTKEISE